MARSQYTDIVIGLKKAATWGTAVTVGSNDGIRFDTFNWSDNIETLQDDSYNANYMRRFLAATGRQHFVATGTFRLKYQGMEFLQALAMGTAAISGAGPYTHKFSGKNNMDGVFGTLSWQDVVKDHTVDSVKIARLAFTGSAGRHIFGEVALVGDQRTEASAGTLTITEPSTIAYPQYLSSETTYQIITTGGTLAAIQLNNWQWAMERDIPVDDKVFSSTAAPYPDEFYVGRGQVVGQITVPHNTTISTTYLTTGAKAGTSYELKLEHNAGSTTIWRLYTGGVKFTSGTANPEPGAGTPQVLNFVGDEPTATPSWTSPTTYIELVNSASTNPLA